MLCEILFRGYSHITMFFAGGISFFLIYICEKRLQGMGLLYRCCIYAFAITATELVFGLVFNMLLGLDVWDYSHIPFNFLGQICPVFFLLWFVISFPAVILCRVIRRLFSGKKRGDDNALVK